MATGQRSTAKAAADDLTDSNSTPKEAAAKAAAANVVAPADGPEHGYVGEVHPEKNNDDYTVAGVTGSTAKANDKPPSDAADATRQAWKPLS